MNERDRYRAVTHFEPPDRPFVQGEGMWPETLSRWRKEGWDGRPIDETFREDRVLRVPVPVGPWPPFEKRVFQEDQSEIVYLDADGVVRREFKGDKGWSSMPQFVRFPVESEEDFDRLVEERLTPKPDERLPKDWGAKVKEWRHRTRPLMYFMGRWGGFFGPLRNLLGLRRLCRGFYEEPDLIEKMMDQRMGVILAMLERVTEEVELDAFGFWEDMAYKNGPLLSPDLFEDYLVPRYRTVCDYLRSRGVDLICVDSDGDVRSLIPLWLKAGLNAIWPLEVQANMDVVSLRKRYGRRLVMMGGIDKRVLAKGTEEIEAEVDRVWPVVESGGFIPHADHSIPPNVPWNEFRHYRNYIAGKAGIDLAT